MKVKNFIESLCILNLLYHWSLGNQRRCGGLLVMETKLSLSVIYPLTMQVVGAPQMILQPVSSIFPCSPLSSEACPFPDVVFLPLPLSALSSSPFHCALQDGFGQTWWMGDMTIPMQFASLYNGQEVFMWSDACWILAQTSSLVTWSLLLKTLTTNPSKSKQTFNSQPQSLRK